VCNCAEPATVCNNFRYIGLGEEYNHLPDLSSCIWLEDEGVGMKRKLNSVRACRALRKENRELRARLLPAWRVGQSAWLQTWSMPVGLAPYLESASRLGFRVEATIDGAGHLRLDAFKRVDA
jgi:hypothetical protein